MFDSVTLILSAISMIILVILMPIQSNHYYFAHAIEALRSPSNVQQAMQINFTTNILFAVWLLKSKRNYIVMLLIYLDSYLYGTSTPDVKPYPIVSYVTNLSGISTYAESLSRAFDAIPLTSFLLM